MLECVGNLKRSEIWHMKVGYNVDKELKGLVRTSVVVCDVIEVR